LLEHPGQVVTREHLRQRLWPADTFVDFDHSLNSSVKKLRLALGDDSDNPRFVETLPRRGYRLIVPVKGAVPFSDQVVEEVPLATPRTIDLKFNRVSTLPGSRGLFSPRWSPDGRYIAAITTDAAWKLMLFDFVTQKWTEAFGSEIGYLLWSHDGKYIYFQDMRNAERIVRLRLRDRKI
jgi:dipeptidyl aminopeptidase/acylaminoacyl peptidase